MVERIIDRRTEPIRDAVAELTAYLRSIEGPQQKQARKAADIFEEQVSFLSSDVERAVDWLAYSVSPKGIFGWVWNGDSHREIAARTRRIYEMLG
jgi:hypothetical protein